MKKPGKGLGKRNRYHATSIQVSPREKGRGRCRRRLNLIESLKKKGVEKKKNKKRGIKYIEKEKEQHLLNGD